MKKSDLLLKSAIVLAALTVATGPSIPTLVSVSANEPAAQTPTVEAETPTEDADVAETPVEDATPAEAETPVEDVTPVEAETPVENATTAEVKAPETPKTDVVQVETPNATAAAAADEVTPQATGQITIRYVGPKGELLSSRVMTGEVGTTFNAVGEGVILGYALNTFYLPDNTVLGQDGNAHFVNEYTAEPQTVTFVYFVDTALVTVSIYDDTTDTLLENINLEGVIGSKPTVDVNAKVKALVNKGYEVASNAFPATGSPFTTNLDFLHYDIYLVHGIETKTETKTATRTVKFETASGKTVAPEVKQTKDFTRTTKRDKVTNVTTVGDWSNDNFGVLAPVDAPTIYGYELTAGSAPQIKVTSSYGSTTSKLTYAPKKQTAKVTYVDETTGKTLETKTLTGDFDTTQAYSADSIIKSYTEKGYELVKNAVPAAGVKFDKDGEVKQYKVSLKHGTSVVSENKVITRTAKFVYEDGDTAAKDTVQKVTFTRNTTTDKVTGEKTSTEWTSQNPKFAAITASKVVGHTADRTGLPEVTVTPTSNNVTETFVYTANKADARIVYYDTVEDKVLETVNYEGKYGQDIPVDKSLVDEYDSQNYLVLTDPTSEPLKFDVDGKVKEIKVELGHKTKSLIETHTAQRTLRLLDTEGNELKSIVQEVIFSKATRTDLVTNEVTVGDWVSDKTEFEEITLPTIDGFKTNVKSIASAPVTVDSEDIALDVIYEESTEPTPTPNPGNTGGTDNGNTGGTDNGNTGGTDNGNTGGTNNENTGGTNNGDTNKPGVIVNSGSNVKVTTDDGEVQTVNETSDSKNDDPQTGITENSTMMATASGLSLMLAGVAGFLGFKSRKKGQTK